MPKPAAEMMAAVWRNLLANRGQTVEERTAQRDQRVRARG